VLKIWQSVVLSTPHAALPGTVLAVGAEGVTVACGEGALCITELQRPGGKRLMARDFLQSAPSLVHQRLGAVD
jgi:methionyl-tRNA formyltransferase